MNFKDEPQVRPAFKQWLVKETCISDAKKNQIAMMVEGQNFVLFFSYRGDIFGAQEPHRVTFARMKRPDDETSAGWLDEANFMAINLSKAVVGQTSQQIFKMKDIDDIEILPKDKVFDLLVKQVETMPAQNLAAGIKHVIQAMKPGD